MGRLIVFEETGDGSPRKGETFVSPIDGLPCLATGDYLPTTLFPILRRLTDEEVEAKLVAATRTIAVDTDRARFVRETAARMLAAEYGRIDHPMTLLSGENDEDDEVDDYDHLMIIDDIVAAAEALAARLWEKRA